MTRQTNTNIFRHIDAYARMGYPVLPLHPGGKRPYSRLVPHGLREASLDDATLQRWWDTAPNAGVGVLPPPSVLVLDCDAPEVWTELSSTYPELHDAPRQRTPRGGCHVFLWVGGGVRLSTSTNVIPGLDLRGLGRAYLVAAPTALPNGEYVWELPLRPPTELPSAPEALLQRLAPPPTPAPAPTPATIPAGAAVGAGRLEALLLSYARAVRQAECGSRHNTLVRYARAAGGLLQHGLAYTTAEQRLLEAALAAGLPEREALDAIRWGLEVGQGEPLHLEDRPSQRRCAGQNQRSAPSDYWNRVYARLRGGRV